MKKILIATLVGAIILFGYKAASWMVLPFHSNFTKYTDKQTEIMNVLNESLSKPGVYDIPQSPRGSSFEDEEKMMKEHRGKPWARIIYRKHYYGGEFMAQLMGKSFMVDVLSVFIMSLILFTGIFKSFGSRFFAAAGMEIFALLQTHVSSLIWWKTPMHFLFGEIVDMLILAVLLGLWMGWYFGRRKAQTR